MADLGQDFQALFVRAADIPEYVADGAAHVGITGADLVAESGRAVTEVLALGFRFCRLALAVRDDAAVTCAADLPAGTRVAIARVVDLDGSGPRLPGAAMAVSEHGEVEHHAR